METRFFSWRVGLILSGVVVVLLWRILTGGEQSVIMIEFGMYPDEFEGLEVVIDGDVVGTLKRMGAATRTGFKVEDGDHMVALKHPSHPSEPVRVTSGFGGDRVMLMANFEQRHRDGKEETYVVLTR